MPRRAGRVVRRDVVPDPKFNSRLVSKMINILMKKEKRQSQSRSFMTPWISWRLGRMETL